MHTTANFYLRQWDPDDRILRTDFNADNARLDAVLEAIPVVRLLDSTIVSPASVIRVPVDSINFTACQHVMLYFRSALPDRQSISLTLNGGAQPREYYTFGSSDFTGGYADSRNKDTLADWSGSGKRTCRARLDLGMPCPDSGIHCTGVVYDLTPDGAGRFSFDRESTTILWRDLRTLVLTSSGTLPAGTRIVLIGTKL